MDRRRALLIGSSLAVAAALALAAATVCGSTGCGWPAAGAPLLTELRLPRALAAFVVGALLALA
ncbi:MAG: iron ABC transporter permease, partial [Burkholderiaceae bacterium]